jgi:hypothetical protein
MRVLLLLSILFSSISSFAGDLNLVCESHDGTHFKSDAIMDNKAIVSFIDLSITGGKYSYKVSLIKMENRFQYSINSTYLGDSNGLPGQNTSYNVSTFKAEKQFPVSQNIVCYVND